VKVKVIYEEEERETWRCEVSFERIPIDRIRIPERRLSARLDEEQEAFLKASIERLGVIHEPVVRRLPDGSYELVAGAHRLRELEARGEREALVKVVDADSRTAIEINLIENIARGTYDPVELSEALNRYLEAGGSFEDLVRMTGHTAEWVRFYLSLEKLPEEYKRAISEGVLRVGHIKAAAILPSPEEMAHALDLAVSLKWPVRILEYYVKRRLDDLRLSEELQGEGIAPPPPSEERAVQMVETYECAGCRRVLHRSTIRTPPICDDCWTLLKYVTDQLGEPKKAMGYIYEAVRHYQSYLKHRERYLLAQEQARVMFPRGEIPRPQETPIPQRESSQLPETPSPGELPGVPSPLPEQPQVISDDRLRAQMKRLLRELLEEQSK